jgi:predicted metalloendopeptidase
MILKLVNKENNMKLISCDKKKTNKSHQCFFCGGFIVPDEEHFVTKQRNKRKIETFHTHVECEELFDRLRENDNDEWTKDDFIAAVEKKSAEYGLKVENISAKIILLHNILCSKFECTIADNENNLSVDYETTGLD